MNVRNGKLLNKAIIILIMITCAIVRADTITILNKTDLPLYGAIYYFKRTAELVGDIKPIRPQSKETFERPGLRSFTDRMFVFSINEGDLKPQLTSSELHILPTKGIGATQGSRFYIDFQKGVLTAYNATEWKVLEPLKRKLRGVAETIDELTLGQLRRKFMKDQTPFMLASVKVRQSKDLAPQEIAFQAARRPKIKRLLEVLLNTKLTDAQVPTIAFCTSGGGYRAMWSTMGSLLGAEETGLLHAAMYVSGVSGSTWAIGPWIQSGWSLEELRRRQTAKATKDFWSLNVDVPGVFNRLLMRVAFKQPITWVNVYSHMLRLNLLSDLPGAPYDMYLHEQAERMKNGDWIFPIYNAVATKLPYQWVEFTPFEVGGDYFGGYIPIWSFGSPFREGARSSYTPPYSLSYILAIAGSAFAARLNQVIEKFENSIPYEPVKKVLNFASEELMVGNYRISAATAYNWTYGMANAPRSQQLLLRLIDAGISYNLGLEPLLRRKADIIVIFDYSASAVVGNELKKAEIELRSRGFTMPPINYEGIETRTYSIFKDPTNPKAPVLIYLPLVQNPNYSDFNPRDCLKSWCDTFNFIYPIDKSAQLIKLAQQSIMDATPAIMSEIRDFVNRKKA